MRFVGAKFCTMLAPVSRVAFLVDSGAPLVALVVGRVSMVVLVALWCLLWMCVADYQELYAVDVFDMEI